MKFTITPLNEEDARAICSWCYEGEYTIYNMNSADIPDMLDMRSPHYTVRDEHGELVGFYGLGTSALVQDVGEPALYGEDGSIAIGLGMRPDLTSHGLGHDFIMAGLDFARTAFAPTYFRLFVLTFNKRAIRAYEKVGFQCKRVFVTKNMYGENEFMEMTRAVDIADA